MIRLIVFCSFFLFSVLFGQQPPKNVVGQILKNGEIRISTTGNQPPYSFKSKIGKLMGYEIELAEHLAFTMNVKLIWVVKPFVELLPALEKGEIDAIMSGMTISPERNLKAAFTGPYIISGRSILAKAHRLASLDEMKEINRPAIKIVTIEGSISQQFVKNLAPNVKLITTKDYESGVQMVLDDKVDLMVADYSICVLSFLQHVDEGLATLEMPLTIEPIGIALPSNDFLLHNMVSNYITALSMTGFLEELEKKWFEDATWLSYLP